MFNTMNWAGQVADEQNCRVSLIDTEMNGKIHLFFYEKNPSYQEYIKTMHDTYQMKERGETELERECTNHRTKLYDMISSP